MHKRLHMTEIETMKYPFGGLRSKTEKNGNSKISGRFRSPFRGRASSPTRDEGALSEKLVAIKRTGSFRTTNTASTAESSPCGKTASTAGSRNSSCERTASTATCSPSGKTVSTVGSRYSPAEKSMTREELMQIFQASAPDLKIPFYHDDEDSERSPAAANRMKMERMSKSTSRLDYDSEDSSLDGFDEFAEDDWSAEELPIEEPKLASTKTSERNADGKKKKKRMKIKASDVELLSQQEGVDMKKVEGAFKRMKDKQVPASNNGTTGRRILVRQKGRAFDDEVDRNRQDSAARRGRSHSRAKSRSVSRRRKPGDGEEKSSEKTNRARSKSRGRVRSASRQPKTPRASAGGKPSIKKLQNFISYPSKERANVEETSIQSSPTIVSRRALARERMGNERSRTLSPLPKRIGECGSRPVDRPRGRSLCTRGRGDAPVSRRRTPSPVKSGGRNQSKVQASSPVQRPEASVPASPVTPKVRSVRRAPSSSLSPRQLCQRGRSPTSKRRSKSVNQRRDSSKERTQDPSKRVKRPSVRETKEKTRVEIHQRLREAGITAEQYRQLKEAGLKITAT